MRRAGALSLKRKLGRIGLETWAEEEELLTEQDRSERCEKDLAVAAKSPEKGE